MAKGPALNPNAVLWERGLRGSEAAGHAAGARLRQGAGRLLGPGWGTVPTGTIRGGSWLDSLF